MRGRNCSISFAPSIRIPDKTTDAGVIYCLSRRKVEETADWLKSSGRSCAPLSRWAWSTKSRQRHQEMFKREEGVVMCATIAFGMGIDKPDVRFVAHLDLPKSVEGYYQETGPRWPRWHAGERVDGVRPRRRRAAAQNDRRIRCRRYPQAGPGRKARCIARAVRGCILPTCTPARTTSAKRASHAAIATRASSRPNRGTQRARRKWRFRVFIGHTRRADFTSARAI